MKNRKEIKEKVGIKYKRYCVGTEPSALLYMGILVTYTAAGHGGSVVSALASQAKGKGSIPARVARRKKKKGEKKKVRFFSQEKKRKGKTDGVKNRKKRKENKRKNEGKKVKSRKERERRGRR